MFLIFSQIKILKELTKYSRAQNICVQLHVEGEKLAKGAQSSWILEKNKSREDILLIASEIVVIKCFYHSGAKLISFSIEK